MCLYAMNEVIALIKLEETRQKDKKPNYYGAFNDLLKINASPKGLLKFYDNIIKWIKKYGCNVFFTEQREEFTDECAGFCAEYADIYSSVLYGDSKQKIQNDIKKKLELKNILYIDKDFEADRGSYVFELTELALNIETLRTVMELYSFVQGEPIIVPPWAQNGKPLLSNKLISSCRRFHPLSKFSSTIRHSFVLEPTYEDEINTPTSENRDFEVIDFNEKYETFSIYCDNRDSSSKDEALHRVRQMILTPSMIEGYPLHKSDRYGDIYFKLACEIVCAYLDTYCSLDAYFSRVNSLYEVSPSTGKFKKKAPSTIKAEKERELWGYIELHHALAQAIMKSRVLKCECCNNYFISKRSDAKTCGDYCRNHLNKNDEGY